MRKVGIVDHHASAIKTALVAIAQHNEGILNPSAVVEAARRKSNPLHEYFEWDDSAAAEQFRLAQATALIRRVRLTISRPAGVANEITLTTTRAFQSRPSQRRAAGGYESIDDIMRDDTKRGELLANVLTELRAIRHRYEQLTELSAVWDAIHLLEDDETSSEQPASTPSPA